MVFNGRGELSIWEVSKWGSIPLDGAYYPPPYIIFTGKNKNKMEASLDPSPYFPVIFIYLLAL